MASKLQVAVVGGTGYTGVELLRLLVQHPNIKVNIVTSRAEQGRAVADVYPNLRGHLALDFTEPDIERLATCQLVFFATPNGTAMRMVPELLAKGVKVIDLAADFRIKDIATWEQWYGMQHACPEWVTKAVYGLPEVNRDAIRTAQLVANPGCYPTATQLGFLPLIEQSLIEPTGLIADTKSGVSGAGRGASVGTLLSEAGDNVKAYGVAGHRHLPEITQGLEAAGSQAVGLTFVPHLMPMIRGIHATLYGQLKGDITDAQLQTVFKQRYANEPFVDVLPFASHPETRSCRGVNMCRLAIHRPQGGNTVVVLSVIDNLVKGAAGQAVHNMNLMQGWPESSGLQHVALLP